MKIASFQVTTLSVPEDDPLADMPEEKGRMRPIVILRLRTDSGIEGIGLTFYGAKITRALHAAVEDLAALTVGKDPMRIEDITGKLRRAADSCGPAGLFTLALSAIDIALWDIKGKALEQPLWKLLGGHRDRVPTYASGSLRRGLTDKQAEKAAKILVEKGFREMKTQMGLPGNPTPAEEVRRVRVVRDAIGPDIKLMCDINQRWRPEQAIDIGSRVEDVGLFWLEDVTTADDYQGLARVTAALKTPVAGGEYLWGIQPHRQMMQAHSVDIVMIDLVRVGGVSQFMKIAGMAEAFNLPVVSHVMPEMLVHVIAACPNGLTVEYMPWMLKLYEETPKIEDGQLVLPNKPGLGLKFDEKVINRSKV
ncbi:MAG TPA: mandelate racemase/muconate lactonizing enzyme family protein [Reyranella sp.]|jgi:L-alanine-DL-glutamate epimerase-like enolase superfamily enzyme|nr:mandelate racemase/muconate lactonizing enzyme family protein [Reyranella sp.]